MPFVPTSPTVPAVLRTFLSARLVRPAQAFVHTEASGGLVLLAATAAAIHEARTRHPTLPVVGVEPALKPAVAASKTGRIGVIGTRGTLTSAKFAKLLASLHGQAEFIVQPCDGLAHAIERSTTLAIPETLTTTETLALCARYTDAMGKFGAQPGEIDTLVLGCTHYVFVQDDLRSLLGPSVQLIAT
ncbi:MAG: aspartate/glutamate racemase family protein, partial [Dehalococcoidia bacterium]|nr:aspartate/glutamate racemase family protein [Dehalococcoidia bacterium]